MSIVCVLQDHMGRICCLDLVMSVSSWGLDLSTRSSKIIAVYKNRDCLKCAQKIIKIATRLMSCVYIYIYIYICILYMCIKPFVQETSLTLKMHNYYSTCPKLLHDFFLHALLLKYCCKKTKGMKHCKITLGKPMKYQS